MSVALHHRLEGPAGAPVVVLAGSLGTALESWDAVAAALAARHRVLRYDHRGHGGSPVPPGPYAIEDLAGDALALLDEIGIERVTWCGLSIGGMVGMRLALDAPERIGRLVLACTAARLGSPESWHERAALVRRRGVAALVPSVLERWFTPGAAPDAVARHEAMLRATPAEGYAGCCEAIAGHDVRAALGAVRAPTLAVAGAEDPATPPPELEAIAAAIPGARVAVLDRAAHLAPAERPAAFAALVLGFLAEEGMRVRREVLGDAHVDAAAERAGELAAPFQDLITRYAWGDVWTRPGLDRRMRSAITITALVARGHEAELALHLRAARRNGLSAEEIREVLMQAAIYCGVPAANAAFAVAQRVLAEE